MNRYRIRPLIFTLLMTCLFSITYCVTDLSANSKAEELKRKIADIGLLKQQLGDRQQQAEAVLASLVAQQNELLSEVRLLQRSLNFKSYQETMKSERSYNNIELLRIIMAYTNEFTNKIRLYQTGQDKLTYLQQLADDDIKMIGTLNDFEIDALTTQISLVINKYLGEAHIIQIDPEKIKPSTPETVWETIVKGK
ncbi:MAG: hypothetical protein PVH87_15820 [Desulfobacteraceae bacterium]